MDETSGLPRESLLETDEGVRTLSRKWCLAAITGVATLSLLISLLVSPLADRAAVSPRSSSSSSTTSFDFYLMTMSWQPQFCYANRYNGYVGCETPDDYWKAHWTIHGLWPQFSDGSYPSTCSNQQVDSTVFQSLSSDLDAYWPNVKSSDDDDDSNNYQHYSFWQHEWSKHGTCSGMSPSEYFQTALAYQLATPSIVGQAYGQSLSKQDLQDALVYDVVLRCSSGKYLQEVRACLSLKGAQIDCPSSELQQSNCYQDSIYLASFPSDD